MTARTTITQAEMQRAIRAARKEGVAVQIENGKILFLANAPEPVQPSSDETGENTCDEVFGVSD